MMQGTPFTGKITITVRIDKDGNPTTRGPGDLTGEYKKNPVEVGAKERILSLIRQRCHQASSATGNRVRLDRRERSGFFSDSRESDRNSSRATFQTFLSVEPDTDSRLQTS